VPVHMIRAGAQRRERDAHGIAADPRFALIDASAARVGHGDRAERWLEALGEPDHEVVRRGRDRCADRRVGMIAVTEPVVLLMDEPFSALANCRDTAH